MPKPVPVPDALVAIDGGLVKPLIASDGSPFITNPKPSKPGNGNNRQR